MFDKVKRFFDMGLYSAAQVYEFVRKGKLSEKEYKEIVGVNEE